MEVIKHATYWRRDVSAGDALDRRVEVVKRLALNDLRADLAADAKAREATLNGDESTSLSVCVPPDNQTTEDIPVCLLH